VTSTQLFLSLDLPPSVNKMFTVNKSGRMIHTAAARKYLNDTGALVLEQTRRQNWTRVEDGYVVVCCRWYLPDRRKRDITNYHKALCDALTRGHVWDDDDRALMDDWGNGCPSVDRGEPRVEVVVRRMG
jgi:crossover junction endodeoxyribonuclease RusA